MRTTKRVLFTMTIISSLIIVTPIFANEAATDAISLQANQPSSIAVSQQLTVKLKDISKGKQIDFRGAASTKEIAIPIPKQWNVDNIQLHLTFNHPVITDGNILITIYVDNKPTYTTTLTGAEQNQSWDVTLYKNQLTGEFINLKVVTTIGEYNCNNLSNPSYWLTINSDSAVTYNYSPKINTVDLAQFPYPFINNTSLTPDNVTIVIPDRPTSADVTAAFYMTNYLYFSQISHGIQLSTIKLSELTPDIKTNTNIIFIGTAKDLALSTQGIAWPLNTNTDGNLSAPVNDKLADKTGVILQAVSPWNAAKSLLAVTGNTSTSITKAVQALRNPNFSSHVAFTSYAFVTQADTYIKPAINWKDVSFKQLGYKDQVVFGNGENQIDYDIPFPMDYLPSNVAVTLNLATSPIMSQTQDSYATILVNDVPLQSTVIKPNTKLMSWDVKLDRKKFWPGDNNLSVILNLKSPTVGCRDDDQALAWATVLNTSSLSAKFISSAPYVTLSMLPLSTTDLILAYPFTKLDTLDEHGLDHLFTLATTLPSLNTINIVNTNTLDFNTPSKSDILYIGDLDDNLSVNEFKKYLPFYYQGNKLVSQPALLKNLHVSDETPSAIIESIYLPGETQRLLMVITAKSSAGYAQAFNFLEQTKPSIYSHENVVLLYSNNSHVVLQTTELPMESTSPIMSNILKYGLMTLILISLIGVYALIKYIKIRMDARKNRY